MLKTFVSLHVVVVLVACAPSPGMLQTMPSEIGSGITTEISRDDPGEFLIPDQGTENIGPMTAQKAPGSDDVGTVLAKEIILVLSALVRGAVTVGVAKALGQSHQYYTAIP